MANEYVNHVVVNGSAIIDLRSDTVDAAHLVNGYTAHDRSGAQITGTYSGIIPSGNKSIEPSTSAQTGINVTNYATVSVGAITSSLLANLDADFVAGNIKKDVDLFGLVGTLESGGGSIAPFSQVYCGTYTATMSTTVPSGYDAGIICALFAGSIPFTPICGAAYDTTSGATATTALTKNHVYKFAVFA